MKEYVNLLFEFWYSLKKVELKVFQFSDFLILVVYKWKEGFI